jgi:hypothetical protein
MDLDGTPVYPGNCEIRVRDASGVVYAAPSLVAHYMAVHRYLPPPGFQRALRYAFGGLWPVSE